MPSAIPVQGLNILVDVDVDLEGLEILLKLVSTRPLFGASPWRLLNDLRVTNFVECLCWTDLNIVVGVATSIWFALLTEGVVGSAEWFLCHFRAFIGICWMQLVRRCVPLKRKLCSP